MTINVTNMQAKLNQLSSLINNYENVYLNLYNELSKASDYWVDNHSSLFFDDVYFEKREIKATIREIKQIRNIYSYLVRSYGSIGRKVYLAIEYKNSLFKYFDQYMSTLDSVISLYNNLDYRLKSDYPVLYTQRQRFVNEKSNIMEMKKEINNLINKIDAIEKNVKGMIAKINVQYLKDMDISNYI